MWHLSCVKSFVIVLLALIAVNLAPDTVSGDEIFNQTFSIPTNFWSIQVENDSINRSEDGNYTGGVEVSWLKSGPGPKWITGLAEWLPFYNLSEERIASNYSFGQKIFTPADTTRAELITDDRPYAGYLYFGTALLSEIEQKENILTSNIFEVTIGVVGPASGAEFVQKGVHKIIDTSEPMGWDNQLKNELGLDISYTRLWSIVLQGPWSLQCGISPHLTAELGNIYTHGAGGVMFRLGNNLRASFNAPCIRPGFPGVCYFQSSSQLNWYLFAGHERRVVIRNIFLDGNTFADSHSVDKEQLVGENQVGIALHSGRFSLALSNLMRTREFSGQDDLAEYTSLNLSFTL
jgi:hypothetical protein